MHLLYPLVLAALLFSVGVYGVLLRRNAILVLMSVELMLNAVNLLLVAFDVWLRDTLRTGQTLTLFVIVVAAAEVGLGLAIVLQVFRLRSTVAVDELDLLAEPDTTPRRSWSARRLAAVQEGGAPEGGSPEGGSAEGGSAEGESARIGEPEAAS